MDNVSVIMAFTAGLLSFLSPCVLPLVPAYIAYLTGSALDETNTSNNKRFLLYKSIFFVLGFTIIFLLMELSISSLSRLFASHKSIFRLASGILIIIFGVHMTGLFKLKFLYSEKRLLSFFENRKKIGPILLGMAFAAGWSPCIGPVLSSILFYAGSMETVWQGLVLLLFYSAGMAIPFILTALTIESFSKYFKKISRHLNLISVISGILLVVMGLLLVSNKFILLNQYFNFINF
jgi:cytochrome c-type biogenesis protein